MFDLEKSHLAMPSEGSTSETRADVKCCRYCFVHTHALLAANTTVPMYACKTPTAYQVYRTNKPTWSLPRHLGWPPAKVALFFSPLRTTYLVLFTAWC